MTGKDWTGAHYPEPRRFVYQEFPRYVTGAHGSVIVELQRRSVASDGSEQGFRLAAPEMGFIVPASTLSPKSWRRKSPHSGHAEEAFATSRTCGMIPPNAADDLAAILTALKRIGLTPTISCGA